MSVDKAVKNVNLNNQTESELWTDKYRPTKFYELLTDELTNRNILTWLNSWRKDEVKIKPGSRFAGLASKSRTKLSNRGTFKMKHNSEFKKREYNYPTEIPLEDLDFEDHRILIIGGDPGTGKSVLAHTLAQQ